MSTANVPRSPETPANANWTFTNVRWIVCGLLFLATTINYMDRSVFSLIEPELHKLPFMGWSFASDAAHQSVFNNNFGNVLIWFQAVYGVGLLTAGRFIDRLGTKRGYALAIAVWGLASLGHVFVGSVLGFCIARALLGLGESGNFPAAIKATTEWFPAQERALATGLFNSGANAASLVAPLLIPFVTALYGWRAAFLTTGSMGVVWLALWLLFPYNKLLSQAPATQPKAALAAHQPGFFALFGQLAGTRRLWAFALGKGLTDPIWWFYLFWLPKYFNENYGLDLKHVGLPLILIYFGSSLGSIGGGYLSGFRMKRGASINDGRKFALLVCACLALPTLLVPWVHTHFPSNVWLAVALLSSATAAHQGWSANIFSTPAEMFPSTAVSTVVGIGGAAGALGGVVFTIIVKSVWTTYPILIFVLAASAYLLALAIFQILVPRLGTEPGIQPA